MDARFVGTSDPDQEERNGQQQYSRVHVHRHLSRWAPRARPASELTRRQAGASFEVVHAVTVESRGRFLV